MYSAHPLPLIFAPSHNFQRLQNAYPMISLILKDVVLYDITITTRKCLEEMLVGYLSI